MKYFIVLAFLVFLGSLATETNAQTKECNCPDLPLPVCGDDGNTYENNCESGCAGVKVVGVGKCP